MSSGDCARPGGQGGAEAQAEQGALPARAWAEQLLAQTRLRERDIQLEPGLARLLDALPPSWTALHDRRCPDARLVSIDHVVIGPPGVFVVASVSWSGTATLVDGVLLESGQPREAVVADAADAALPLAQLLAGLVGSGSPDVQAVLCISGAEALTGRSRGVLVCSPDTLADQLTSMPDVLDDAQAADLGFRLDLELHGSIAPVDTRRPLPRLLPALTPPHLLTSAPTAPPAAGEPRHLTPENPAPRPWVVPTQPTARDDRSHPALDRRRRDRQRTRRARLSRRIAHAVLLVVVLVTFGPAASSVVSDALSSLAVPRVPVLATPSMSAPSACPSLQGEPSQCAPAVTTPSGDGR